MKENHTLMSLNNLQYTAQYISNCYFKWYEQWYTEQVACLPIALAFQRWYKSNVIGGLKVTLNWEQYLTDYRCPLTKIYVDILIYIDILGIYRTYMLSFNSWNKIINGNYIIDILQRHNRERFNPL